MTVLSCANCGAPRDPNLAQCGYCGAHFADGSPVRAPTGVDPEIVTLLRQKNLIGAIKVHRERHNSSLREAKTAVEALQKRLGL